MKKQNEYNLVDAKIFQNFITELSIKEDRNMMVSKYDYTRILFDIKHIILNKEAYTLDSYSIYIMGYLDMCGYKYLYNKVKKGTLIEKGYGGSFVNDMAYFKIIPTLSGYQTREIEDIIDTFE